jgi:hypothetical protein
MPVQARATRPLSRENGRDLQPEVVEDRAECILRGIGAPASELREAALEAGHIVDARHGNQMDHQLSVTRTR